MFRMGSPKDPIKVLMPVAQAEAGGLRCPITRPEAEEVLQVFRLPATALKPHSKEDLDEVAARLSSHDPRIVAATIRDLMTAGVKGWLGQPEGAFMNRQRSEQVMLTRALERLIEELAYVRHTSRKTIEERIRTYLGRTRRRRGTHNQRWYCDRIRLAEDGTVIQVEQERAQLFLSRMAQKRRS